LHPKLHPNRSNNSKDVKGKGGCGGGNGFQSKGKAIGKSSNKDNITKAKVVAYMPLFMIILLNCKN